jgi:2,4-didehydro-3-deoxy-L-rhamnonate hydrolase
MKLVRFGNPGAEKPGLVDNQGRLRDLSNVIADLTPANLSRSALQKIAAIAPSTPPLVAGEPRFGVPVADVRKFIAIGLNYADHAAEANLPLPSEPIVFQKAITSLSGPNYDVVLQKGSKKSDWEVELGIVIGTQASYVERADALAHVAGYCFVNDVSKREYQMERGGTWEAPTIRPVGRTDRPVTCFRPDSSHERE